jgi:cell shape-determining protein MreC
LGIHIIKAAGKLLKAANTEKKAAVEAYEQARKENTRSLTLLETSSKENRTATEFIPGQILFLSSA